MALQKTPLLSETVVDLITEQLKSNFNKYLSEADYIYTDGIRLEKIDDEQFYISNIHQPLRLPAIFVLFQDHAFQYTRDQNYLDSNDSLLVILTGEDIGAETLTRKMHRYGRVLLACLNLVELGDSASRINLKVIPNRLGYTQPISEKLQDRSRKFRMDVVLEITVQHWEKNLI